VFEVHSALHIGVNTKGVGLARNDFTRLGHDASRCPRVSKNSSSLIPNDRAFGAAAAGSVGVFDLRQMGR
jgi:hypothetical protein